MTRWLRSRTFVTSTGHKIDKNPKSNYRVFLSYSIKKKSIKFVPTGSIVKPRTPVVVAVQALGEEETFT